MGETGELALVISYVGAGEGPGVMTLVCATAVREVYASVGRVTT